MNDKKIAPGTADKFQKPGMGITRGAASLSEVDALLNELLPHSEDKGTLIPAELESVPYKDIRRVRLPNGISAVRLPCGITLARSLDRISGHV
ncbi:MAG: hypothetical protein Q7U60_06715, partial [Candidatus Methanoperedens sp.]|nr:hypothetical protein [Candidatus Methanoperedens sp.]